jgi:hypothetical protein
LNSLDELLPCLCRCAACFKRYVDDGIAWWWYDTGMVSLAAPVVPAEPDAPLSSTEGPLAGSKRPLDGASPDGAYASPSKRARTEGLSGALPFPMRTGTSSLATSRAGSTNTTPVRLSAGGVTGESLRQVVPGLPDDFRTSYERGLEAFASSRSTAEVIAGVRATNTLTDRFRQFVAELLQNTASSAGAQEGPFVFTEEHAQEFARRLKAEQDGAKER